MSSRTPKKRTRGKKPPSSSKRTRGAQFADPETLNIEIIGIDVDAERAVIHNLNSTSADLSGYEIHDVIGNNRSEPLKDAVIPPFGRVNVWTAPASEAHPAEVEEDDKNFFWRNRGDKKPRKKAVLNDDGDGLELVSPEGDIVASAIANVVPLPKHVKIDLHDDYFAEGYQPPEDEEDEEDEGDVDDGEGEEDQDDEGEEEEGDEEDEEDEEEEEEDDEVANFSTMSQTRVTTTRTVMDSETETIRTGHYKEYSDYTRSDDILGEDPFDAHIRRLKEIHDWVLENHLQIDE